MNTELFTKLIKLGEHEYAIAIVPPEFAQHIGINKSNEIYLMWSQYGAGLSIIPFSTNDLEKIKDKFDETKKYERQLINNIKEEVRQTQINIRNDNRYNDYWTKELRQAVRFRDNYECQRCHRTQEEELAFDVHHINEDKENPYAELITLCPYCHKIVTIHNKQENKITLLKILEQRNLIGWTKKYLEGKANGSI